MDHKLYTDMFLTSICRDQYNDKCSIDSFYDNAPDEGLIPDFIKKLFTPKAKTYEMKTEPSVNKKAAPAA